MPSQMLALDAISGRNLAQLNEQSCQEHAVLQRLMPPCGLHVSVRRYCFCPPRLYMSQVSFAGRSCIGARNAALARRKAR